MTDDFYLKRREGGPKGRPSEASLNFFCHVGYFLVNFLASPATKWFARWGEFYERASARQMKWEESHGLYTAKRASARQCAPGEMGRISRSVPFLVAAGRKTERQKINEDRAKRDPNYVYFEERVYQH